VLPLGSIIDEGAAVTGFMAAAIAVGGFLGHAWPVIRHQDEAAIRVATVVGGLYGLAIMFFLPLVAEFL
jgi:glycerol-3-phosphate acyltransferase PlsY